MKIGQKYRFSLIAQVNPGGVSLTVFAHVLHQSLLNQRMASLLEHSLFLVEIAFMTVYIFNLPVGNFVVILVDQTVAEEYQDHEIGKPVRVQGIQFCDETKLPVLREKVFQLLIKVPRKNGAVVQILKEAVQELEEFCCAQPGAPWLLRHLVILQSTDNRHRDIELVLIFSIVKLEVLCADKCVDLIAVRQSSDIADVQVTGNVAEIHATWTPAKTNGQKDCLLRCQSKTTGEFGRDSTVFGPELLSELGIIGFLRENLHQLEYGLFFVVIFHRFLWFW